MGSPPGDPAGGPGPAGHRPAEEAGGADPVEGMVLHALRGGDDTDDAVYMLVRAALEPPPRQVPSARPPGAPRSLSPLPARLRALPAPGRPPRHETVANAPMRGSGPALPRAACPPRRATRHPPRLPTPNGPAPQEAEPGGARAEVPAGAEDRRAEDRRAERVLAVLERAQSEAAAELDAACRDSSEELSRSLEAIVGLRNDALVLQAQAAKPAEPVQAAGRAVLAAISRLEGSAAELRGARQQERAVAAARVLLGKVQEAEANCGNDGEVSDHDKN